MIQESMVLAKAAPPPTEPGDSTAAHTFLTFKTNFSADGLGKIRICMLGFIDDNNLQTVENAFHHAPMADGLVDQISHDAQIWNDTLWTSDGALALLKCQYHLMEWMFTLTGKAILLPGKYGNAIKLHALDRTDTLPHQTILGW
jgi:hypothetical protein